MKRFITITLSAALMAAGCNPLDTMIDSYTTQETLDTQYSSVIRVAYAQYGYLVDGLAELDGNIAAPKSDEAVATSTSASSRYFNNGSWSAYYNPDNRYENFYKGIRAANFYLEDYSNYKERLSFRRDTLAENNRQSWLRDIQNAEYLYAEAHVAKAYYYFELLKRYGDVPLYKSVPKDKTFLPRTDYQKVAEYAVDEIDGCLEDLAPNWSSYSDWSGRFDKGAAMALKSRILLYAASPLNTEGLSDAEKSALWQKAAMAAHDIIAWGKYSLSPEYKDVFTGNTSGNSEIIMSRKSTSSNALEKENYPIGTPGGNSGITPSGNLVDAYEYIGTPDPSNPYANRDKRFYATIVYNGAEWNGRTIDISNGGTDSYTATGASRTGYYLRKYLTDALDLANGQLAAHQWVHFRYGEILLNYAEAANEAWGPDETSYVTTGTSARMALNKIRQRAGLGDVDLSKYPGSNDKEKMRNAIKAERRVELAFEDHRFWDLMRWKDHSALNTAISGVIYSNGAYTPTVVENRVFEEHMLRYPIPFSEVSKSNGVLNQNPGW